MSIYDAYLLGGYAQSAAAGVIAYLGRAKRGDEQIMLSRVVDHLAFWRSEHARIIERPAIAIRHALLGLTSNLEEITLGREARNPQESRSAG